MRLLAQVDQFLAVLGKSGLYRLIAVPFTVPWTLRSIYETAPLRTTLTELVDPAVLNDEETRVFVGATNVGTCEIEFFDSRHPRVLTSEQVVASGKPSPELPGDPGRGGVVLGRGLVSNIPLSPSSTPWKRLRTGIRPRFGN